MCKIQGMNIIKPGEIVESNGTGAKICGIDEVNFSFLKYAFIKKEDLLVAVSSKIVMFNNPDLYSSICNFLRTKDKRAISFFSNRFIYMSERDTMCQYNNYIELISINSQMRFIDFLNYRGSSFAFRFSNKATVASYSSIQEKA